jgi:hypothetical protein
MRESVKEKRFKKGMTRSSSVGGGTSDSQPQNPGTDRQGIRRQIWQSLRGSRSACLRWSELDSLSAVGARPLTL